MVLKLLKKISLSIKLNVLEKTYKNLNDKQTFEKIYRDNEWNKKTTKINSGPGSHDSNLITPYVNFVSSFLKKTPNLKIVDLGCGDFNIGGKIFQLSKEYIGVDIVEKVIMNNRKNFKNKKIKFLCLNVLKDEIPKADCIIIRQVFQHLDNYSIIKILNRLKKFNGFKYLIITEHIPENSFTPNIDKSTGPTTRLHFNSGIDIEKHPFDFQFVEKKELKVNDYKFGGLHKTVLYKVR